MEYIAVDEIWPTFDDLNVYCNVLRALRYMAWESYFLCSDGYGKWYELLTSVCTLPYDRLEYIGKGKTFGSLMIIYAHMKDRYPDRKLHICIATYGTGVSKYGIIDDDGLESKGESGMVIILDMKSNMESNNIDIIPMPGIELSTLLNMDPLYKESIPVSTDGTVQSLIDQSLVKDNEIELCTELLESMDAPDADFRTIAQSLNYSNDIICILIQIVMRRKAERIWNRIVQ